MKEHNENWMNNTKITRTKRKRPRTLLKLENPIMSGS